ncbi:Inosine/uridine-preferring nucleoside hydrolase domain-containing protein [Sordaria brevicollis]|uniref:Inosine/uridine-preferring nucleoside hydrolase domain-containing protein n=1 Tax=Sordaria brevicollis TaxID=83679 RepID=A0AAE0P2X8_SORBR|nr:Inosine/uridine-preferring nucleoside hydrolase domain-containing protein [Sordaria brevicollis]
MKFSLSKLFRVRTSKKMVPPQDPKPKVNLIIDTDIFSDVDDAGALLLAATSPHANLLGVLVNKPSTYSVLCASAIVSYYTSSQSKEPIPIGVYRHRCPDGTTSPLLDRTFLDVVYWHLGEFCSKIAYQYGCDKTQTGTFINPSIPWGEAEKAYDSVKLYRKLLAEAEDDSVTIVSIGFLDNLSLLIDSTGAEGSSNLSGKELISKKVKEIIIMGGRYPPLQAPPSSSQPSSPTVGRTGIRSWNFFGSGPNLPHHNGGNGQGLGVKGAMNFINQLPTLRKDYQWKGRVVYVGEEVGRDILTGAELVAEGPKGDPVGKAYRYYAYGEGRASWDPVAVLYAIYGLGEAGKEEWFKWNEDYRKGRNWVEKDGSNTWHDDKETTNQYVLAFRKGKDSETMVAKEIEKLFLEGARNAAREKVVSNREVGAKG